jgi:hypothetical protein
MDGNAELAGQTVIVIGGSSVHGVRLMSPSATMKGVGS